MKISVIDLFAGPGGLGEGFSAFTPSKGNYPFKIKLSAEKEKSAHKTLLLRAFYRQFRKNVPTEYFEYLRGELARDELFEKYPDETEKALIETLGGPRALGDTVDDRVINKRLKQIRADGGPCILVGGPPCQAYSLVGRSRNKGIKGYVAEKDNRHFLYEEYLRVLSVMNPEVFVMENVKGILSAKVNDKRIFPKIYKELKNPTKALKKSRKGKEYEIYSLIEEDQSNLGEDQNFTIHSEKYGVPQARHRVILLGVRKDITRIPKKLKPSNIRTVKDVIDDCPLIRSGLSKLEDSPEAWHDTLRKSIQKTSKLSVGLEVGKEKLESIEARSLKCVSRGSRYIKRTRKFKGDIEIKEWYIDEKLAGFLNHESRGHMKGDLMRYFFCSIFGKRYSKSPNSKDFPAAFAPKHANWKSGNFVDRFKVQIASKPASTVTSHISKDGHYFIHYDPAQCRSLTVREAARLQTFPDNYFFEGNRTEQYVQVGNAVPPWLASQIAEIVYDVLKKNK